MAATAQVSDRRAASGNRRAGIALTIIVTCQLMVVLDSTVVNIAIAQIHASLHFSTAGLRCHGGGCFSSTCPIGLAVVVLAPRFVPEPPRREGRLDLPGALLSTAGLALLIYGFIRIGEGSSSIGIITGLFAAAVTLLSLFVVVEARSSTPLMPLHLILDRTRGLVLLVMLSISAGVFGMFFFISQYAQTGLHYSALRTGLAFLPLTVAVFALSRIMPPVLARTGPRLPLPCGTALIAISLAWLSRTSVSQGYLGGLFGPLLLFGIGIGLSYVPMGATILKGVDRDDSGSASGIYQAMQQVGGSVDLAILVSIAAGHGQSAALEGAAGFAVLAFVLTAVALSGRAAHR